MEVPARVVEDARVTVGKKARQGPAYLASCTDQAGSPRCRYGRAAGRGGYEYLLPLWRRINAV